MQVVYINPKQKPKKGRTSMAKKTSKKRKTKKQTPKQKAASKKNLVKARAAKKRKAKGKSKKGSKKKKRKQTKKKGGKKRKSSTKKRKRKSNSWSNSTARHKKAAKLGWARRRRKGRKKSGPKKSKKKGSRKKSRKSSKKKRKSNPKRKRKANKPKMMKGIKEYVVPFNNKAVKSHPVPHIVGGVMGLVTSSLHAGAVRMIVTGATKNEVAGDIASFGGNIIGTEVPAIVTNVILAKGFKKVSLGKDVARGMRYGGYIGLVFNLIGTVLKYAFKRSEIKELAYVGALPAKVAFKVGDWAGGMKTTMIRGLGLGAFPEVYEDALSADDEFYDNVDGLGRDIYSPDEYGLDGDEEIAALDDEIRRLSAYLKGDADYEEVAGSLGYEDEYTTEETYVDDMVTEAFI